MHLQQELGVAGQNQTQICVSRLRTFSKDVAGRRTVSGCAGSSFLKSFPPTAFRASPYTAFQFGSSSLAFLLRKRKMQTRSKDQTHKAKGRHKNGNPLLQKAATPGQIPYDSETSLRLSTQHQYSHHQELWSRGQGKHAHRSCCYFSSFVSPTHL